MYFLLLLTVVQAVPQNYFLGSMGPVLESLTRPNTVPGFGPVNPDPLYELEHERDIFGGFHDADMKVYYGNAWSKFLGLKCPINYHLHALDHHLFSEMYVCVHIPSPLPPPVKIYRIVQKGNLFTVLCNLNSNLKSTLKVKLFDHEHLRLANHPNGSWYLTSDYCISSMYSVDSKGNDLFVLNYTVTDTRVSIFLPSESCRHMQEIIPTPSGENVGVYLPLQVEIDTTANMHTCLSHYYTPFYSEVEVGTDDLFLSDSDLMTWKVDITPQTYVYSNYIDETRIVNVTNVWVSSHYISPPPPVLYHVSAAISNSPFHMASTVVLAVFRPLLELILDSLMYIFESVLSVFESPEFTEFFNRLLDFLVSIFNHIISFIYNIILPKLVTAYLSISFKYKFLSLILLFTYLKTTKFVFSACVVAIVSLFFKDK